jgi:hypothetical protein
MAKSLRDIASKRTLKRMRRDEKRLDKIELSLLQHSRGPRVMHEVFLHEVGKFTERGWQVDERTPSNAPWSWTINHISIDRQELAIRLGVNA